MGRALPCAGGDFRLGRRVDGALKLSRSRRRPFEAARSKTGDIALLYGEVLNLVNSMGSHQPDKRGPYVEWDCSWLVHQATMADGAFDRNKGTRPSQPAGSASQGDLDPRGSQCRAQQWGFTTSQALIASALQGDQTRGRLQAPELVKEVA